MKWLWRGLGALLVVLIAAFLIFRTPDTDADAMRAKYGAAPSQFVDIGGGVKVHLRDEGPKDAPAIVLLHGSNADLHTWEPWVAALKDHYRVIRFDQVGHGLTGPDPRDDYSRDNYVAHILAVADRLGLKQFVLGGNSMGGKHALAFAVKHPGALPVSCWSMARAGRCSSPRRRRAAPRAAAISASGSRGCRGSISSSSRSLRVR